MFTNKWLGGFGVLLILLVNNYGNECRAAEKGGKLKFEIYQDHAKEFRWRLKDANGAILATGGQGYKAKGDCQKGVDRLKARLSRLTFEVYEDKAKEFRWRLKSRNGQVVASSSEGYKAKADWESAIDTIKAGAASAEVDDKT